MTRDHWTDDAACKGRTDVDFNIKDVQNVRTHATQRTNYAIALAICAGCTVREQCLFELWDDRYAVAGGTVPAERRGPMPVVVRRKAS